MIKIFCFFLFLIFPIAFADTTANLSSPLSNTNNSSISNVGSSNTSTLSTTTSSSQQDSEAIDKFFKDSDYEHFAPEKGLEFVDPGYLGGRSAD